MMTSVPWTRLHNVTLLTTTAPEMLMNNTSTLPSPGGEGASETDEQWLFLIQIICLAIIALLGTVGNCLIFTGIWRSKRKSTEYFILNLATTDLLVCAIGIPLDVYERHYGRGWPYARIACQVIYPSQTLVILVSIMTLTAMSLERYRAIMTPLKQKLQKRVLLGIILSIWMAGIAVVAPYSNVLRIDAEGYCHEGWSEANRNYYTLALFIIDYCIPLTVITYCYGRAGYQLHGKCDIAKREDSLRTQQSAMRKRIESNKRVIKTFSFAVAIFVVCMLPGDVYWMWTSFGNVDGFQYDVQLRTFTNIMLYANSAINPFIFGACRRNNCGRGRNKRLLQRLYHTVTDSSTSRTYAGSRRPTYESSNSDKELTHV